MKKINKKGFTLTELIVVIAVIAILAAVLIPTLTGYIEKARISADNQEVAVLNKLLLDAEINEVEFKDVTELKKYLAEEMDYDGDYSLGVKGSYLWYNQEKYEFVIVNEDEVAGLQMMADKYTLARALTSPEGLLYEGNDELWLVGGKGELVELVQSIRNVGNTGEAIIIPENLNSTLKTAFEGLFTEYVFVGTKGSFTISTSGVVTPATDSDGSKVISANASSEIKDLAQKILFNSTVIEANIQNINDKLKNENGEAFAELVLNPINNDGSYNIDVVITEVGKNTEALAVIDAVQYAFEILLENGCANATIVPIINNVALDAETYVDNMNDILADGNDEDGIKQNVFVPLSKEEGISLAIFAVAYAFYYEDGIDSETWASNVVTLVDKNNSLDAVLNKNKVKIFATIDSESESFEVIYNFNFTDKTE